MVSWSTKRQLTVIAIITAFVLFLIALPTFLVVYEAPTCVDGKQNQGEFGVDCGGPCALLCEAEALQPIVRWQRVFPVTSGVFNAVAYIENPNLDSTAKDVPYRFRIYDAENVLVYEREGRAYIPPRKVFGIFEDGFLAGERTPVRALFEFTEQPVWVKTDYKEPDLRFLSRTLSEERTAPRLDAVLENRTLERILNIEVVAIVYDGAGNAIGASRTIVDSLPKSGTHSLVFTWPRPFSGAPSKTELLYRVLSK